ncbi:ABC transporter ATP-binding protein [Virgisporangium aurantiacum]|uniref:Multidrug ABC transporter permease n=1 Tax=Virgisporangium aurantiacum TaxID=175570 RepID=A0A8J4E2M3_9ACTN|nr:ABC transporter ATP-binding protein [Virgisporangium aurantiacum]GIJ57177.1 multidrug ABC transporter permease [Virgisporangium aurantiacum]
MTTRAGRALGLAARAAPGHVTGYLLVSIAGAGGPLATAWLMKAVIDRVVAGHVPWTATALLAVAGVVTALVPHAIRYLRTGTGRRTRLAATGELYAVVNRFVGLRPFEDPEFLDHLQVARTSGTGAPVTVVDSGLGVVRGALMIAGFAGTLLLLGPWIAVAVLLSAVPSVHAELALSRRRAAMVARVGRAQRREMFYSNLLVDVDTAKEVRLFGAGGFLFGRMLAELRAIDTENRRVDRRELVVQGLLAVAGALVAGGLLLFAVRGTATGALTVGDVALVVAAVAAVQTALGGLVTDLVTAHQGLLLFGHWTAVVDAGSDLPVRPDPAPAPLLRTGIELRDVWFRYADDQPWVLRGVDLTLAAGRTTAVVGLNGAGKSTLVKLLCRLYDPVRGAVLWDGVDIRQLDPTDLRARIRAVFQDAVAYDLTAHENVAIGDVPTDPDRGRVEEAARAAGVDATLAGLAAGYDTPLTRILLPDAGFDALSERALSGVTLSGGQWQRVAIARGVVRDRPDLLILDEPSSALDAEAEHEVHRRLRALRRGRTSLLISHRLGVVREADVIVVIRDGRVAERGSHDGLMADGGTYAHLFDLQAAGYREVLT